MNVAVIGAGLEGSCVALEFARRGASVHLLEKQKAIMSGASRHNEGKIHLGFVYANDPCRATPRLMSHAALMFAPLLREHLETDLFDSICSEPFLYAVHARSLLGADELEQRYEAISQVIGRAGSQSGADYFGVKEPGSIRRLSASELRRHFDPALVLGAFETREIAVDPDAIADALACRVMGDPRIVVRTNTDVAAVTIRPESVALTLDDGNVERFDQVVNCAWCGRLALDASAGVPLPRAWSFRRKWFVRLPAHSALHSIHSTTIVLGGFGDIVRYRNGDVYLSWYPVGCRAFETGLTPSPPGENPTELEAVRRETVRHLSQVSPGVGSAPPEVIAAGRVRGGIIFARGDTDVDDRDSLLHQRHCTGPQSFGRYHTIDTGKYTTAPLFARQLVQNVTYRERAA